MSELNGRELDAAVAERVMGLKLLGMADCVEESECGECVGILWPTGEPNSDTQPHPVFLSECRCANYPTKHVEYPEGPWKQVEIAANAQNIREHNADLAIWGHSRACLAIVAFYSSSIETAMQVEDRIAELGLQSEYYRALLDIVARSTTDRLFHHFDLIHASAEQRCRAALAVMSSNLTVAHTSGTVTFGW